jgi:transposase
MKIIGFDVSKNELVGVLINKQGKVLERYTIPNTKEAISTFLDNLKLRRLLLGSEATAEYHYLLAKLTMAKGVPFRVLNPIITKQFTRATVRKRKTDRSDALVIAKCLLQGEGYLVNAMSFDSAKRLLRSADKLGRSAQSLRRTMKQLEEYVEGSEESSLIIKQLSIVTQQAEQALRQQGIDRSDHFSCTLLTSIPGIGMSLAPTIATELGDLSRFKTAKALAAYAGLDPKVKQSGTSLARNTRITKRGSPYLRRAFFIAASVAQRHDVDLKNYYLKKRGEGKRYKEVTVANARHLVHRVYAVLKRGTPYQKREISTPVV